MEKYMSFVIVAAGLAVFVGAMIAAFQLYSKWNARAMLAYSERPDLKNSGIGGFLWLPAIWTVTDFFTGFAVSNQSLLAGTVLIFLAFPNAVLFWSRSWLYPHFFLAKTVVALALLMFAYGPSAVGYGALFAAIAILYLYLSKRAKSTFIHRLNGTIRSK